MVRVSSTLEVVAKPSAVIFDTDNTLYPYDPAHKAATMAVEKKAAKLLGVGDKEFRAAVDGAKKEIKGRLGKTASSHSRLLYFQRAIELLGMRTKVLLSLDLEQTYWRTFLANCKLFPDVREFILSLKNEGIVVANITDLTAQIQFRKLVYFGLDECFDYVITSEEAGRDKPDRRPFEIAIGKIGYSPECTWMIGDSVECDVLGAKEVGMKTFLFSNQNVLLKSNAKDSADYVFSKYSELKFDWGG